MKTHTSQFKEDIKTVGKQLDSKITFKVDGVTQTLTSEDLNGVTPTFQGAILKSVMKELDIDSNVNIPIGTEVNYQFGVKLENDFEYLDYGNYIVYSSEKQEDTSSYKIICYDKMLYSMKQNEDLGITYPISIRNYINALCTKIGLEFKNKNDEFANFDRVLDKELYVGLDYTYRDILDELAQVTASTICLNSEDKVEIRYINDLTELNEAVGTNININDSIDYKLNFLTLYGKSTQATRSGKNLFDSSQIVNVSDYIVANGTGIKIIKTTNGRVSPLYNISLKANTEYTISCNLTSTTTYPTMYCQWITNDSSTLWVPNLPNGSTTFTPSKDIVGVIFYLQNTDTDGTYVELTNLQIEKGSTATDYEPHGVSPSPDFPSPIESITEISATVTGKNLLNPNGASQNGSGLTFTNNGDGSFTVEGTSTANVSFVLSTQKIKLNANQPYTQSITTVSGTKTGEVVVSVKNSSDKIIFNYIAGNQTITPTEDLTTHTYTYYVESGKTVNWIFKVQLEKETQASSYEEYKSNSLTIDLQGNELCSLPNGTKDEVNITNGEALLIKRIGKVILDGSEDERWSMGADTFNNFHYFMTGKITDFKKGKPGTPLNIFISDKFHFVKSAGYADLGGSYFINNLFLVFSDIETINDFKTWLSTHNVEVLYELAEPETINLGTVEMPHTYEGVSNITNSADTEMIVKYSKGWETINEEYLKDINVNFGQKNGPVNSVVLTRGAESDNIYLQDENSIAQNGLCEIKIADNQIMNWNDRSDYLPDIFEKLDGLEYYLNDFSSTGIAYLDLCDRYNVEVFGNTYSCVMFNDELLVTQGLEENVHTDMPEETETDYTKADKTDKKIKQAYIIVDKQNQTINSVVQDIGALSDTINSQGEQIEALGTRITQTTDNITATVTSIQDTLDNGVNLVKTTAVIVDNSGLTVATDTSKTTTKMTSDKFAVTSGGVDLAFFGYDETEGRSKAEMDNLTVKNYLTAGYHRQEKFEPDGEKRTGWFYVGGDI